MSAPPPLTLEDRMAIHDLVARYSWALDTGDVDALVDCFTPDGVVIEDVFEDADRWEGAAGVRRMGEFYRNVPNFPGRQHHTSQLIIDGDGERASLRCFVFVTECQGEPPYLLRFTGRYEDHLVKLDDRWLFAERIIRLWDGEVFKNFPGHDGVKTPRKRPPQLMGMDSKRG